MISYGPTPLQLRVHAFMRAYQAETGIPPSLAEIARSLGYKSRSSAFRMVKILEHLGMVARVRNSHRYTTALQQPYVVVLDDEVDEAVRAFAKRTRTTPEVVLKEAVRAYVLGDRE